MKASVVVPVYNAQNEISRTLDALLEQDFERDYEIIPVDDGSTDGTKEILEKYSNRHEKIKPVYQEKRGPAAARNRGAEESSGEFVLFTDSDCVPEKDWISQMVSSLEKEGVIGVQGRYECLNKNSTLARFIQYEVEERYERMERQEYIDFVGSYSAGYDRKVFLDFGGFDEDFKKASGEDPELSYRLDKEGYKMVFNPDAVVKHEHPDSIKDYLKMKFGRGYWGRLLYKKHPEKKSGQSYNSLFYFLRIPLTGLLSLGLLLSLSFDPKISLLTFILLPLLYMKDVKSLAGKELKFSVLGFPLLYLKYLSIGIGIIKGYLDF